MQDSLVQTQEPLRDQVATTLISGVRMRLGDYAWCYLFILPFVIFFLAFSIWPLVSTIGISLFNYNGIGPMEEYVGLSNYDFVLHDQTFIRSFINTVVFAALQTTIKLPIALLLAIILTRSWLKIRVLFRTVFFMPLLVPGAIVGMVFVFLLNPANGAINDLLQQWSLIQRSIDFISSRWTGMSTIAAVSAWNVIGQYVVYWMAALQNVPEEVYEAAEIDGANEWQKLIRVTLPIIRPMAIIITFLGFVNALHIFDLVLVMTGGGPGSQTFVMAYYIYTRAFTARPSHYGRASAAAVVFGFVMLIAFAIQGYFVNRAQRERHDFET
jgi:ABC-type sugar transport system permease subunit